MGKLLWTLNGGDEVGVRGLTSRDIGVVFQPIVEIATGAVIAHEALVRCKRPEYASPPALFEAAVKEEACGWLGRVIRDVAFSTCGDVALFVNLHPSELGARWIVRADDPIGFQKRPVYLEITESATFTHHDLCLNVLAEVCKRTGARLVVDDFGAGYSNLERLAQLEPAVVKLDLAMIRGIHRHPRKQIVCRHVVGLCRELGALVVAEGVETLDELMCVRDLGFDLAQGYLLARPAAPPPAHAWPLAPDGGSVAVAPAPTASRRTVSGRLKGVTAPSKSKPPGKR